MDSNTVARSGSWIQRWIGLLATVLFAAATLVYLVERASTGSVLFTAAATIGFGVRTWRAWQAVTR